MNILQWDKQYSVNNTVLDGHHQRLFDILNELYTLMAIGASDEGIIKVITELLDYTHYHFSTEEEMMERVAYPELAHHRQLHQQFIAALEAFQKDAQNGKAIFVAVKVADIGVNWLKTHILTVDSLYDSYLSQA